MKKHFDIFMLVIVAMWVATVAVIFWPAAPKQQSTAAVVSATNSESSPIAKAKPILPTGSQTFQVMQSPGSLPKIIQTTINPPDVHVGDTQKLTIILQDPNPIVSVEAQIATDNGTTTLPLTLQGNASVAEILPQKYYVDGGGELAFVSDHQSDIAKSKEGIAFAAAPNLKYSGSWIVHDTHNITYHTIFIAKDSAGNTSSVTMDWSDACGIPNSGNTGISGCSIGSPDGAENGSIWIYGGLTLWSGFAFNPGYSIVFSGGTISIGGGGYISKSYICDIDADGDGWGEGAIAFSGNSGCGGGYIRRYLIANPSGDCYDYNGNAYPGQGGWFSTNRGDGSYDYNCDGAQTPIYPYACGSGSYDVSGAYSWGSVPACGVTTYMLYGCYQ